MTHLNREDEETTESTDILELIKLVKLNTEAINKINSKLEEKNQDLEDMDDKLEKWDTEVKKKIDENLKELTSLKEKNESFKENFSEIKDSLKEHTNLILKNQELLDIYKKELDERVIKENFQRTLNEAIEKLVEKITELKQNQESITAEISETGKRVQSQITGITNTIDIIGEGLEQLDIVYKNQASTLQEHHESLIQFKKKIQEIVILIKEDQKNHFDNFSRLLESFNENIHTEISLMAQSLKESDIEVLNEVSTHYTRKKVGEELQKKITELSTELAVEAKKTHDDLVEQLQESVKEYENIMEIQTSKIKNYQNELQRFQEEIQSVIDRKVNEKYEVVFSLLSKVVVQAEELALLIKTAEIKIPKVSKDSTDENHLENLENNKKTIDNLNENENDSD